MRVCVCVCVCVCPVTDISATIIPISVKVSLTFGQVFTPFGGYIFRDLQIWGHEKRGRFLGHVWLRIGAYLENGKLQSCISIRA